MRIILLAICFLLATSSFSAPIQVEWEDQGTGSVYIIERSVDNLPFEEIGQANESDKKFVDSDVVPLVLYRYRVKAIVNGSIVYSDIEEGMSAVE